MDEEILFLNGYHVGKTIGEGTYSKVKEAYSISLQRKVAVKIIDKTIAPAAFIQKFLPRELHIVPTLHHKNIIEVYKIIEAGYHRTYMIMELADGGDIFDHIIKNGAFLEDQAQTLFHQLVEAIHYLHNRGVAHRDLKCENTLLDHGVLKLADFGFAKILPTSSGELTQTFCGSLAYAAPEVLQGVPYDSQKGDIWSMGVLLYVMLSATLPFHDHNIPKMLMQQQRSVLLPDHIHLSEDCRDLVKRLLEPNAVLRPSINEVIRHPWLNHY